MDSSFRFFLQKEIIVIYFAYGSNMDQKQMYRRCPGANALGMAALLDYMLAFTRHSKKRGAVADIVPKKSWCVYGIAYEISEGGLLTLDQFEGHPTAYRRTDVVIWPYGKATAYEVVNKVEGLKPSKEYLELIIEAARKSCLPDEYLWFLENGEHTEVA